MKKLCKGLALFLIALLIFAATAVKPVSAEFIDEITDYEITVDVNEDGTLNMHYHIEWLVLDDEIGKLEYVWIGIPNSHFISYTAVSPNIKKIQFQKSSTTLRIDFYEKDYYGEGETAIIEFDLVQDYMYGFWQENQKVEYQFTPAWFDEANVDKLVIRWNNENVDSYSPAATVEDGYVVWETYLPAKSKFTVNVTYMPESYNFDTTRGHAVDDWGGSRSSGGDDDDSWSFGDVFATVVGALIFFGGGGLFILGIIASIIDSIKSGFTTKTVKEKKIKRTLIEYYPSCPNCGAPRAENATVCEYCGTNFIKSEEVIEEDDPKYKQMVTDGDYKTSNPNIFVHVMTHEVTRTVRVRSSCVSSGGSSSCAHSSCASSCACACASSCACACASSGGGRAGCSVKDFYNTGLTVEQIEKRKRVRKNHE